MHASTGRFRHEPYHSDTHRPAVDRAARAAVVQSRGAMPSGRCRMSGRRAGRLCADGVIPVGGPGTAAAPWPAVYR